MKIVKRNGKAMVPFYRPLTTMEALDRLSREIWDSWSPFIQDAGLVLDFHEENGQLVMKTELPGIERKDLHINLEGNRLIIQTEKKEEIKQDAAHPSRESYYEQYFRSVTLPYPVKEGEVTAKFDRGILELRLPKGEEPKAGKIEIKAQLPKSGTGKSEQKTRKKKG